MECKPSTYNDISRYFLHSYVKLREFGDKLLFLESVNKERCIFVDADSELFEVILEESAPYHLEYVLPRRAVFAFRDSVYLLQRVPARQYHRGCCDENTRILEVFTGQRVDVNFRSLTAYVAKPSYVDLNTALFERVSKRTVGVPLTNRISFSRLNQLFYVDTIPVATFNREANAIMMKHDQFYPELSRLSTKANLSLEFVNASGKRL